ncbi:hypothetical protein HanIR_Chr11g0559631 [Helianthus annuus]|nr:hypothetical protein HanIR_Chr11g0559631 [Helianthus annuus]
MSSVHVLGLERTEHILNPELHIYLFYYAFCHEMFVTYIKLIINTRSLKRQF